MIRALVFDFDGLILETEGPILRSWQEIYQTYGLDLTLETWSAIIGTADPLFDPLQDLEARLGSPLNHQQILQRQLRREAALIIDQPPLPGVREHLQAARRLGIGVALASSSSCAWVEGHLTRLGLIDYFDCIQAQDDVAQTKPDPALYIQAVACLGVQPHQAIAFEDSPNGIRAARKAGLFCVAVPNALTRHLDLSEANLRLESLAACSLEDIIQLAESSSEQERAKRAPTKPK
jgi:HAD superfamily hydrolase (TIGR01509 family)